MTSMAQQIDLEFQMVQNGIQRYQQNLNKQVSRDSESNSKHGRAIISATVDSVAEGVRDIQKFDSQKARVDITYKKIHLMDAEKISYMSLITVVDALSKRYTLLKIARLIGIHIELQQRLDMWLKGEGWKAHNVLQQAKEKTGFDSQRKGLVHKMNKDGYEGEWTNEQRIHVGLRLVDKIISLTGLVRLRRLRTGRKTTTFIEATEHTLEWIKNFNYTQKYMSPRYVPCVIPPREWTGVWAGGYHSPEINRLPFVRCH